MLHKRNIVRPGGTLNAGNGLDDATDGIQLAEQSKGENIRSGAMLDEDFRDIGSPRMRGGAQRAFPITVSPVPGSFRQRWPGRHQFFHPIKLPMRGRNHTSNGCQILLGEPLP